MSDTSLYLLVSEYLKVFIEDNFHLPHKEFIDKLQNDWILSHFDVEYLANRIEEIIKHENINNSKSRYKRLYRTSN